MNRGHVGLFALALGALVALAASTTACEADGAEVIVEVKTDLVVGVEFIAIRTELAGRAAPIDRVVYRGARGEEGLRAAEIGGVPEGDQQLDVSLLDAGMRPVLRRRVRVRVNGPTGVTVLFTRSCEGVTCPGPGDDARLTECVSGTCADPSCIVEVRATCPPAECAADADCTFAAACAEGRCVDDACLAVPRAGACASTEYCHPDLGCLALPEPVAPDAGPASTDAGGPTDDAGACCGYATCRADCLPCGTCGDGSEGDYAPTADGTLTAGVHRFRSMTIPAGVTIRAVGTEALQLLSRGPVQIDGVLDLSGAPGNDAVCGPAIGIPGVDGVAGGGRGGGSGQPFGEPGGGTGGGGGGQYGGGGGGGGGGGSALVGASGASSVNVSPSVPSSGGAGGAAYDAFAGATFVGGSGGGGAGPGSGANGSGATGGAGGGAVLVVAPTIAIGATGAIRARGGNGGDGGGVEGRTCDSGAGGGGSGGSVWLRASAIAIEGSIDVDGGAGGIAARSSRNNLPGAGGDGSVGQIRLDALEVTGVTTPAFRAGAPLCDGAPCE